MKKYARKNLNIKKLLASGNFDVRGIAEKNKGISADAYFSSVERFITKEVNKAREILLSVAELEEKLNAMRELETKFGVAKRELNIAQDSEILNDLDSLKKMFSEVGCNSFIVDIDCIRNSILKGDLKLSEKLASETFANFSMMLDKLKGVYSEKKFSKATDVRSEDYSHVSLNEALEFFDYEEENRKLRILAVDDVSIILNAITSALNPYYEVFALKSSSQVEKFLTHTTPELFLLDIEMNDVNGFELVPMIRRFKEHKDTPIIFLTGNASYNNLKDAIALGACDFITKPVKQDILIEKISKNIVRKKAY